MFDFLRALGLSPLEWDKAIALTKSGTPYVGTVLDAAFAKAKAVVVILSPDDEAQLREPFRTRDDPPFERKLTGQPRPNVLFEAGMAFGRHERETIIVQVGKVRPFSDSAGRHVVRLDNKPESRSRLANRLESAGCAVDREGADWISAGDFVTP